MAAPPKQATEVLEFWFAEHGFKDWFAKSPEFDAEIRARFGPLHAAAVAGELDHWAETPAGVLALILMLDQFSRNLHRGNARAFAADAKALGLARQVLERGLDNGLGDLERAFLFLPFEHSEAPRDQELSVQCFAGIADPLYLKSAAEHKAIIDRFGRYPHRNAALGRESTPEEIAFLAAPGSSF